MAKRLKRKGETVTFSVSVAAETKQVLRDLADRAYGGNVSELITQIAEQAARQAAARELLELHGRPMMTDREASAFEAEIAAGLAAQAPVARSSTTAKRKGRRSAA